MLQTFHLHPETLTFQSNKLHHIEKWRKCCDTQWSTMGSQLKHLIYLLNTNNDRRLFLIVANELNELTSLTHTHFCSLGSFLFVYLFGELIGLFVEWEKRQLIWEFLYCVTIVLCLLLLFSFRFVNKEN